MIKCKVCGADTELRYKSMEDRQYKTKQEANYYGCFNCSHLFVSPDFSDELIASFYQNYTTHDIDTRKNGFISFWREIIEYIFTFGIINFQRNEVFNLKTKQFEGRIVRLLDVGCGSGDFLSKVSNNKNISAYGVDFDLKAVEAARKRGLKNVSQKKITDINEKFDLITLNHVIEHIQNICQFKKDLIAITVDDGELVLRTPNVGSLCSRLFGRSWRGLESPRHLNIFSIKSASIFFSDYQAEFKTSNAMLFPIWVESFKHYLEMKYKINKKSSTLIAVIVYPLVACVATLFGIFFHSGEELVIRVKNCKKA